MIKHKGEGERDQKSEVGGQRSGVERTENQKVRRLEGKKKTNLLIFLNSYLLVNTIINPKAIGVLLSINVIPFDKYCPLTWICV